MQVYNSYVSLIWNCVVVFVTVSKFYHYISHVNGYYFSQNFSIIKGIIWLTIYTLFLILERHLDVLKRTEYKL